MATEPPPGEAAAPRRSLPWILFAISTAFAVLAATGFVYLITQRTTGPAEVLHEYYTTVTNGDCEKAYEMLAATPQRFPVRRDWCADVFPTLDLTPTFQVRSVTLEGDFATVVVWQANARERSWTLVRAGRSWMIGSQGVPADPSHRTPVTPAG